ncbi:MAG: hypothetical protein JSR59_27235 [Proteobacteria bacterium]|nr:hypothetical protein [Pseudomonadota bacterium]
MRKGWNAGAWIAAVGLTAISAPALAVSTWTASSSSCWSNTNVAQGCSGGSGSATVIGSAYSTTGSGSAFATGSLVSYTGGFGVTASGESTNSPQHSMDNSGTTDAILLSFSSSVVLSQVTIGWAAYDSDFTLLRYTGSVAPTVVSKSMSGLLSSGWQAVGDYMNTVSNPAQSDSGSTVNATANVNSGSLASSWWLISAYNSSYSAPDFGGSADSTSDYIKILSVAGSPQSTQVVSEPGSMALVALALGGMLWSSRRRLGAIVPRPVGLAA